MEGVVKILVQVIQKAIQAQPRHLLRVPLLPQQRHRQRLHQRLHPHQNQTLNRLSIESRFWGTPHHQTYLPIHGSKSDGQMLHTRQY